jgi:hypothetical protein
MATDTGRGTGRDPATRLVQRAAVRGLEKCPKLVAAAKTASEPASGRDLMGDHPQFRLSAWFFVAGYGGLRRSKNGSAAIRRIRNFRCTERLR